MVNYIDNAEMLAEVVKSKQQDAPTEELAAMWIRMVEEYAKKPNWSGYPELADWKQEALCNILHRWRKFDPERTSNPFSYYTQCIHFSFLGCVKRQNTQKERRDEYYIAQGAMPSYWTAAMHEYKQGVERIMAERDEAEYRKETRVKGKRGRPPKAAGAPPKPKPVKVSFKVRPKRN